jgi:hypothetical protein
MAGIWPFCKSVAMGMTGIAKMVWGWPWVDQRNGMGIQQAWRLAKHKINAAQLIGIPVSTRIQGLHEGCCRALPQQKYAMRSKANFFVGNLCEIRRMRLHHAQRSTLAVP